VRQSCRTHAVQRQEWGIWGGTSEVERAASGRAPRYKTYVKRLRCGTEHAFRVHRSRREPACDACLTAHRTHLARARLQRERLERRVLREGK
jgi:hypothetical protein